MQHSRFVMFAEESVNRPMQTHECIEQYVPDPIAAQYQKQMIQTKVPTLHKCRVENGQRQTTSTRQQTALQQECNIFTDPHTHLTQKPAIVTNNTNNNKLLYHSPEVDANLNDSPVIGVNSNAIENDRQLNSLDVRVPTSSVTVTSLPLHKSLLSSISNLLGLQDADMHYLRSSASTHGHSKLREMQVRLSMNDPLFSEKHRTAHRLYVSGKTIPELRAAGVDATHLMEIGVTYDDWAYTYDLGVQDLIFLGAEWKVLLQMGFQPNHITADRTKAGPTIIAQPPLCISFQTLEQTLGLTVDEAVFSLSFTTADFSVLGESLNSLIKRGLNHTHVAYMQEPIFNFEKALNGSADAITCLFPPGEHVYPQENNIECVRHNIVPPPLVANPTVKITSRKKKPFSVI